MRIKRLIQASLALGLICLQSLNGPAFALDAKIKIRTPFCREAKAGCQPSFYLTPVDAIRIEGQSSDGKWLRIRHLASGQSGWVAAVDIQQTTPSQLKSETVTSLAQPALALVVSPEGLQLLEKDQMRPLEPEGTAKGTAKGAVLALKGLDQLQPDSLRVFMSDARELKVYGLVEIEKQLFLQEVQPALQPFPRFRTLLRLNSGGFAVARLPDQILLVLGAGSGSWGAAKIVGLDQGNLPVMVLREAVEIQNYMAQDIRSGLRGESMRLLDLEPDGTLVMSAYHANLRRDVLLRLQPSIGVNWDFQGQYIWPKELPFRPDALGLKLRMWHEGDQTFVLARTESTGAGYLIYYAGGSEPMTVQKLETPVLDAVLYQSQLWTLQSKSVIRWQPVVEKSE
ncbi:MAG TPA: hypothetical protein V6D23_05900 [Candidatus Obscuribacterales bacterium]